MALLLQYVLDCLHKIFLYDTQGFLSKERADALMSPLLDQVTQSGLFDRKKGLALFPQSIDNICLPIAFVC